MDSISDHLHCIHHPPYSQESEEEMKLKTLAYTKVFTKGYGDKIIKRATEMGYTLTESKLPLNQEPIDNYRSIPFLMFTKDEIIPIFDMVQFLNDTYTEISAEDFLSVEWPPFTKVLVRDSPYTVWLPNLFSQEVDDGYETIDRHVWTHCILYEGNEDLVFTDNPKS